jgi:diguanylate cyclase
MTGLLFGTTLLSLGVALGFWMGRKTGVPVDANKDQFALDPQRFLTMVRAVAAWTNDIAGDVSKYKTQLNELSEEAQECSDGNDSSGLRPILNRIVSANEQLQKRLEAAEQKLEQQTSQLEGYLQEARTDALTGLANRRAFDQRMDELFASSQRTNKPFTLAMIDIDHFKSINDTYGHASGDVVLRHLAGILKEFSDQAEMAARYGGEEFAMIFSEPVEKACEVMEKIRIRVAAKPIQVDSNMIPVTLSSGVAQLVVNERLGDLFRHSDEALYRAKQNGRNQVIRHQAPSNEPKGKPTILRSESASITAAPRPLNPASVRPSQVVPQSSATTATLPSAIDELERRVLAQLDDLVHEESRRPS